MNQRSVTILGAGLVGSVLAVLLRKRGYEVTIYERRPDMRKEAIGAGRSINLAMSNRGWKALELAGLREDIESIAIPMPGRFLHQEDGSSAFQSYGKNGEAIYSVSRGELNKKLMDLAENNGAKIYFNQRCAKADTATNTIYLQDDDGINKEVKCDLLFGADGAFSSLRTAMAFNDRTNFSQYYIEAGYKELNIPAGPNGTWLIEKNALHIWPRHNYMMIALPNVDGSFTCTLFFPFEGKPSFESIKTKEEVKAFFDDQFPDAVPLMPTLVDDFMNNPVSSLITTKIFPWRNADKSCLIGDAAHAIVPFYGQGMNAGFEDCSVLEELMENHGDDWETILSSFEQKRKPNADAVADLALNNFIEMRDKVADPVFLERKKIEKELGRRYAGRFNSVYEMVSFSHTPYAYALHCTKAQDILLGKIISEGDFFTNIEKPEFVSQLENWIEEYEALV
jgi:kynurenine 3-monooxygenase